MNTNIIAVTGGRDYQPTHDEIVAFIEFMKLAEANELRHGDCRGVDRTVVQAVEGMPIKIVAYPADWSQGRKAGPLRNRKMLTSDILDRSSKADILVAFPGGAGTLSCVTLAESLKIHVLRIEAIEAIVRASRSNDLPFCTTLYAWLHLKV